MGPSADALPPCTRLRRAWDERAWPSSTRGHFHFRTAVPELLELVNAAA